MISCPFCGEEDFDLIGLKDHLLKWCKEFKEVQTINRLSLSNLGVGEELGDDFAKEDTV